MKCVANRATIPREGNWRNRAGQGDVGLASDTQYAATSLGNDRNVSREEEPRPMAAGLRRTKIDQALEAVHFFHDDVEPGVEREALLALPTDEGVAGIVERVVVVAQDVR